MTLKSIMNAAGALGHAAGSTVSLGAFVIVSTPSTKVKAAGLGVYRDALQYSFVGGNAAGFQPGTVATVVTQSIDPTATKDRADGELVIREGDSGSMACEGVPTGGGPPVSVAGAVVEVAAAGQDKAKGQ